MAQPSETSGNRFDAKLQATGQAPLRARAVRLLQINLGKLCNQACRHCHVDAGPQHTGADENMGAEVVESVLEVLRAGGIDSIDLTGGAPELNPHFRMLIEKARALGVTVIDRCNLSVLSEPGQEDLAEFLAAHGVEVVASLPSYRKDGTDRQRGAGVFDKSIAGLERLNALGYGDGRSGLVLNLVYNPVGAFLPGDQTQLEADYKRELGEIFGVRFDRLYAITNMPIARFLEWLRRSGKEESYLETLLGAFNPAAAHDVMCRDLISIGPDGRIYDCDFNQMLGMPVAADAPNHLRDFDLAGLAARRIVTGDHCLGCAAGAGSSCAGAVTAESRAG